MEKCMHDSTKPKVRLDKWLWAARFYKTRALARQMVEGGKVQYQYSRSKPGKNIEIGAEVTLRQGTTVLTVIITAITDKRGSATEAQQLYQETDASIEKREQQAVAKKQDALINLSATRPNKKQRRDLFKFKTAGNGFE
jgi:ribosome-associated heat shock protein Hsp15